VRTLLTVLALIVGASSAAAAPAAPAFTLRLLDGSGVFDLREQIGKKVVVVRFQASWCKICREEAPGIERTWQKYKGRGVDVVGIQVQDTARDAQRFLKASGATYPAGLDPRETIANRFAAKGTPYTVVINRRGEIVARIRGRGGETSLARILDPLVKPPPPRKPPARLQ